MGSMEDAPASSLRRRPSGLVRSTRAKCRLGPSRAVPLLIASRAEPSGLIVERSTTGSDPVDGVETGWTEPHFTGLEQNARTNSNTLPR